MRGGRSDEQEVTHSGARRQKQARARSPRWRRCASWCAAGPSVGGFILPLLRVRPWPALLRAAVQSKGASGVTTRGWCALPAHPGRTARACRAAGGLAGAAAKESDASVSRRRGTDGECARRAGPGRHAGGRGAERCLLSPPMSWGPPLRRNHRSPGPGRGLIAPEPPVALERPARDAARSALELVAAARAEEEAEQALRAPSFSLPGLATSNGRAGWSRGPVISVEVVPFLGGGDNLRLPGPKFRASS